MPRHIIEFWKLNTKKNSWKQLEINNVLPVRGTLFQTMADISSETTDAKGNGMTFFKCWKKRTVNCKFYIQQNGPSWKKTCSDEEKLREFVANKPTLKEWLKEVL